MIGSARRSLLEDIFMPVETAKHTDMLFGSEDIGK